jgi:cyclophilin family peptidyl-prolyl cis-trans isomerase
MKWFFRVISLFAILSGVAAAMVNAPSGLKVKALGANAFQLQWKDNSDNETGWEILANVGAGGTPVHYTLLPGENINSYQLVANNIPGKLVRFQVRAYRGEDPDREYSAPSSIAEATAFPSVVFEAAENVKATAIDESRVRIRWRDVSTTESGYIIGIRKGKGEWETLANTAIQNRYNIVIGSLEPSTSYSFRVVAFKSTAGGQITSTTSLSNESTTKTDAFRAPFGLTAKSEGEGRISLTWKERSSLEEGMEVQAKEGDRKFKSLGTVGANTTSTSPILLTLDTPYDFRVRAFRTVDGKKVYSKFSNVASKKSSGLAKPMELAVSATTESSVTLTWKDVSTREEGYALRYKEKGKKLPKIVELPAGATTHTVTGLKVGKFYDFQVRTFDKKTVSRYTPVVEGSTRDQLLGNYDVSLTAGVSFFFDVDVNEPTQVDEVIASNLPAGLTLDESSQSISGIVTTPGVYEVNVKVRFKAGYEVERTLVLRVIAQEGGPVTESALANTQVGNGAAKDISLNGKFRDSDVSVARRFTTNLGTFDVVLFEDATPQTVENFLAYADGGRYRNTFFHRAPAGFVVQGGGFTHNGSTFGKVSTFAPVQNEPGISNLEGTVAMAKLGGDPNSATSQFFINLSDANAPNLDSQNRGFTVFGRIAGDGMDLFQDIDALPKGNYTISPGGETIPLDDVPVNTSFPAPGTLDPATLVRVTNVADSPILAYTATSLSPAVATVSITGSTLRVTGVESGTARIRVRATDLDGLFADQLFDVTVP